MSWHHIPLSIYNLVKNRRRFVVSLAGVALAVILMFIELGFLWGFIDASLALPNQLNGQLVIVRRGRYSLTTGQTFKIQRLHQARAVPGVKAAMPVYVFTVARWKKPLPPSTSPQKIIPPTSWPIRVIAFPPEQHALKLPAIQQQQHLLKKPGTVLMDHYSKESAFGKRAKGDRREFHGRSIEIVEFFHLGTDFAADGNLIMSDRTYADIFAVPFADSRLDHPDVGVIQLEPQYDPDKVKKKLQQHLPNDVWVFTHTEFLSQERNFWLTSTPIGYIFQFGLFVGGIVGVVICWQILSADVSDRAKEYATLKAIGYSNGYLTQVVLWQSVWLSLVSYAVALVCATVVFGVLAQVTGLPMRLDWRMMLVVLALTVGMCMLSGMFALRPVQKADPAEVF